jgi:hypothetical protein
MSDEAVAAPVDPAPQQSIHDRIKAHISEPAETPEKVAPVMGEAQEVPQAPVKAEAEDQPETEVDEGSDDAQEEAARQFSSFNELLEAAGLDPEKGYELEVPTKIDGKEGKAKFRDVLKSYQLDQHINNRLETLNTDRKALEAKQKESEQKWADGLLQLDSYRQVAEADLMGQYGNLDWSELANKDINAYNQALADFHARKSRLENVVQYLNGEKAKVQEQQKAQYEAHLAEQKKLVEAEFPQWADQKIAAKDRADMSALMEAVGAPKGAFETVTDLWQAKILMLALQMDRNNKEKPRLLKRVKEAKPLLKPGAPTSAAASSQLAAKSDFDRLKRTGKIGDATAVLRRQLFG